MKKNMTKSIKIVAMSLVAAGAVAVGALATAVRAEVISHEVTETSTVTGTVSDVTPTSRIVVTSTSGAPTTYTIDKKTVFVDEAGTVVSYDQLRGQPVKVYVSDSKEQPVVVERVVVTKPVMRVIEQPAAPQVIQRTETRTETRTEEKN